MNHQTIEELRPDIERGIIHDIIYLDMYSTYVGYLSASNFKLKTGNIRHQEVWEIASKLHQDTPHIPITPMAVMAQLNGNVKGYFCGIASITPQVGCEPQYLALLLLELSFRSHTINYLQEAKKTVSIESVHVIQEVTGYIKDLSNDVFESISIAYQYLTKTGLLNEAEEVKNIIKQINQKIAFIKGHQTQLV